MEDTNAQHGSSPEPRKPWEPPGNIEEEIDRWMRRTHDNPLYAFHCALLAGQLLCELERVIRADPIGTLPQTHQSGKAGRRSAQRNAEAIRKVHKARGELFLRHY